MDIRGRRGALSAALLYNSIEESARADQIEIDLSLVTFIDPAGLAAVAALSEYAVTNGRGVKFVAPVGDAATYASRMHLGTCLAEIGVNAGGLTAVRETPTDRLFELHRFDPTGFEDLAASAYRAAINRGAVPQTAADMFSGLVEVMENAAVHSGMVGGWAAMQVQESRREINFAVADAGMGLRASLEKFHAVGSDEEAVKLAFQKGISGTSSSTRGLGLNDLLGRVTRGNGVIRAWSGLSAGMSQRNGRIFCRDLNTAYPGTMVYASLQLRGEGRS